jgi:hypothetical protein
MVNYLDWVIVHFVNFGACVEISVFSAEELRSVYAENSVCNLGYYADVMRAQNNCDSCLFI